MSGSYFLLGPNLEKCGKFWKNGRFSGRIWPDWGNTTRVDMAGLGSKGLRHIRKTITMQAALLVFKSVFLGVRDYGSIFLSSLPEYIKDDIQVLQKKRTSFLSKYNRPKRCECTRTSFECKCAAI